MKRRSLLICITVIVLAICSSLPVYAENTADDTGSVSVTLKDKNNNKAITGAELSLYLVAVKDSDGYVFTEDFEGAGIDLTDGKLAVKLDGYLRDNDIDGIKSTTDSDGKAKWSDLTIGLYLVRQTAAVEGYALCTPFTVTVPLGDSYDVDATPKTDIARLTPIVIKKVWNTDKTTETADSVTVQLLRDGNVVESAVLNKNNNWQITFEDMPESDAYSVAEIDIPNGFTATYSQSGYVFTVTNSSTLIQTGQLFWPIPMLAVSGILLIAAGFILIQKKRKNDA